jgi:thiamine-phosphate pyrophosphorylase
LHGIYAIVNAEDGAVELARAALEGGIRILQYRAKGGVVETQARAIRQLARAAGALFLINDDWRAAQRLEADGAHLGPGDATFKTLPDIRREMSGRIVGFSCGTAAEAQAAQSAGVDYIGVGSVYATASKSDAGDPIGLEGLRTVASATSLPVAAIGGITAENLRDVRATGVAMAAVVSALSSANDPRAAAQQLVAVWNAP